MLRRWAALVCLTGLAAGAEEPAPSERPDALPADDALASLLKDSLATLPELLGAQELISARAERVPQAGALSDPMLGLGLQNEGFTSLEIGRDHSSYVSLMASQTFPWPGKLSLREELAALGVDGARQALERLRLSTEASVRRAYLDLSLVRDRVMLLNQLETLWQKSLGVARARYEAGDGAQSDVLRAQLELNRVKQRRFALRAEEKTTSLELNRLSGRPLDQPVETRTRIRELPSLAGLEARFSEDTALSKSPELLAARLGVARSDRSVALAQKGYFPDLTVGAGLMVRGALPPMWQLSLSGPLPLYAGRKQGRAVSEGRALGRAAEHEVTALEQLLRLRTRERRAVFRALRDSIALYEQGLLVQSEATTDSTLAQYKVGKVSFASVLEANAGFIADQEGYLEATAAAHRVAIAEAELSLLAVTVPAVGVGASRSMPGAGSMSAPEPSGSASEAPGAAAGSTGGGGMPGM